MKKIFLLCLIVISSFSYAQELFYGVKLGNNISNFGGDDSKGFSSKSGLSLLGSYRYLGDSGLGFELGGGYSSFGANAVQDTSSLTVNYFDLQYYLMYNIYYRLNVQVGLDMGFKVEARQGGSITNYYDDGIRLTDYRIGIGTGYQFERGFTIDVIYKIGLGTIFEAPEDDYDFNGNAVETQQLDIKNRSLLISVGYFFN